MATEAEVVHPDDEEETGETSSRQRKKSSKIKGTQIFTIDDVPSSKWEEKFQDFHAWMII